MNKPHRLLLAASLLGCATGPAPRWPPPLTEDRSRAVILTVVSAEISPEKPNGEPWEPREAASDGSGLLGVLAMGTAVLLDLPPEVTALAAGVLSAISAEPAPAGPPTPDPFVRLSFGKERFATSVQLESLLPSWEYPLLISPPKGGYITLSVIDADAASGGLVDDPIGSITLPARELRRPGVIRLGPFGAVKSLVLKVERYDEAAQSVKEQIPVGGTHAWTDIGVNVIAGQRVEISATGRVCASGDECSGPEGFPLPRWRGYSLLPDCPHEGLLLRVGDGPPMFVGPGGSFIAAGSGPLLLGPNDTDLGNNRGEFLVDIAVR